MVFGVFVCGGGGGGGLREGGPKRESFVGSKKSIPPLLKES